MPTIEDAEFGTITIQKNIRSSSVRIRVAPNGRLRVSAPRYTPTIYIKRLITKSRDELRDLLATHQQQGMRLYDGMQVGKSHSLSVTQGTRRAVARSKQRIIATLAPGETLDDPEVNAMVRDAVTSALRREAKSYLPKRLAYLAQQHGFSYSSVRFSHAGGRWGSCSSGGTISLNIALMKLPFELIDYVLYHELAHTKHLNHSDAFWATVQACDPAYLTHRRLLKKESPAI